MKHFVKTILIFFLLCPLVLADTHTSAGSGLWSAAGTWDAGVPHDGDVVNITNPAHEVEFDADMSGFVTGVDLHIDGTLTQDTAADSYLKCSADIDGAGTWNIGTSDVAFPEARITTINLNGAHLFDGNGGLTLNFYCTQPTNKYVLLSGVEAIGQTELSVNTDLTADIWKATDTVRVNDTSKCESEERIIDAGGIAAAHIDITVGLTAAKGTGSTVVLVTRNIRVIGHTSYAFDDIDDSVIGAEVTGPRGFSSCQRTELSGVMHKCTSYGIYGCTGFIVSGVIVGGSASISSIISCWKSTLESGALIAGCPRGMEDAENVAQAGKILGCDYGMYTCRTIVSTGDINAGTRCFSQCADITISNCVLSDSVGLYDSSWGRAYNVLFSVTTEFQSYTSLTRLANAHFESFNHNQVENAVKDWWIGGITTSQTLDPPSGFDIYYEHACESEDYPCCREAEFTLQPDEAITIECQIRLENLADFSGYAPRIQIVDAFADNLIDPSEEPVDEDMVSETTGDGTTWQSLTVSTVNITGSPKKYLWRVIGYHATAAFDEVISLPDYKTQIQAIYDKLPSKDYLMGSDDSDGGFDAEAKADIGDSVWDEAATDHITANTFGERIDEIRDDVTNIGLTGSAVGVTADSATVTTGTETNDYTYTQTQNETYHVVTAVGGVINYYYEFDIGAEGTPVSATAKGRVNEGSVPSGGDTCYWYVYDWDALDWTSIGYKDGIAGSDSEDDILMIVPLFSQHVGTVANDGKVRIRFGGTALEANTAIYIDHVNVQYANIMSNPSIADAVWDEAMAGHTTETTFGGELQTLDPNITLILADTSAYDTDAEHAAAIWNAATASYGGAGTYGQAAEDTLADTSEIQTDQVDGGRLDVIWDAIKLVTDRLPMIVTTVSDANDANSLTLTAGDATADSYLGNTISIQDADDGHWESRMIISWTSARVVVVDEILGFTPAVGDVVVIWYSYYPMWAYWEIPKRIPEDPIIIDYRVVPAGGSTGGTRTLDATSDDP